MATVALNDTVVLTAISHCSLSLVNYNYSLYRSTLAACNVLNGQRSALALVLGFAGATFWICSELCYQLASRFTNWWTLYPWTILISTCGTIVITSAHILNHMGDEPAVSLGLEATGWICMVTGFALVLWSRLNILIKDRRLIRTCLAIIIINALICHPPVIIASIYTGIHKKTLLRAGFCLDVLFLLQENGLAILYIFAFVKFVGGWNVDADARSLVKKLVLAEAVVFCTDITPLSLLYAQAYVPREAIHPFCYAVKLKIEFLILNELVRYSQIRQQAANGSFVDAQNLSSPSSPDSDQEKWVVEGLAYSVPEDNVIHQAELS